MAKTKRATVHDLTTERARRDLLPWSMTIDVGKNRFRARIRSDAKVVDLEAMALAFDAWARALRKSARELRKAVDDARGSPREA